MCVLAVDVDPLEGTEGRQQFAVVHVSEDRNDVVVVEGECLRLVCDRSLCFVFCSFKGVDDPLASIKL